MTIHELAEITHVKIEAIRSYRLKGFLHPKQNPKNRYYEYSPLDLYTLLFIRKQRGVHMPLDTIGYTFRHTDFEEIYEAYRTEKESVEAEIDRLLLQKEILEMTMQHLTECKENSKGVSKIRSIDEKIDLYTIEEDPPKEVREWLTMPALFTQSLHVEQKLLEEEELPDKVPVKRGIGTYRKELRRAHMPVPKGAVHFPMGTYVTTRVELDQLDYIPKEQLQPMIDYIRSHDYTIKSGTTGFLYRLDDRDPDKPKLCYRLRVLVEKKN